MIKDQEPYVPFSNTELNYPLDEPDKHIIGDDTIPSDTSIDKDYNYVDRSFKFRFISWCLYYLLACIVAFNLETIILGLKINGREYLRKYKKSLKNGAITICNHVLRWDFICILQAIRFERPYVIVWKNLLFGKDSNFVRYVRGIPIPETQSGNMAFMRSLKQLHQEKKWIHVFPEGSNWHFFQPIRPFKPGAFLFAHSFDIPIIPMAISYRKATGIYKLWNKNTPLITLNIGEPIFADKSLNRKASIEKLLQESHKAVCLLAGIKNNPYPASFKEFEMNKNK